MSLLHKICVAAVCLFASATANAIEPSGTLPVMTITTENSQAITSKEDYVSATYSIDPKGTDVEAFSGDLQIRGRGNYTWTGFDKKPYRIKLGKKTGLLGMKSNKHFGLLAHADDSRAFLRNPVGFFISKAVGLAWTPDMRPVEVILNGDYIGLYFLTELIRVDKDRVDIYDQEDEEATPDPTGGWLCEIDNYEEAPSEQITITEGDGSLMRITHKSPEILNAEQEKFLRDQYEAMNTAIYNSDPASTAWSDLIDVASATRFYVTQEITDNYESYHGSCYMFRDRGDDKKWNFGPVWDFGSTLVDENSRLFIWQGREHHQHWIEQMNKFTNFKEERNAVMEDFVKNHYDDLLTYIDEFIAQISDAAAADAQRWPKYGNTDIPYKVEYVKRFLKNRVNYLMYAWGMSEGMPADIYLRGEFNGWAAEPRYQFRSTGDNVYLLDDVTLDGIFKIGSFDWATVDLGGFEDNNTPQPDQPFTLNPKGCNLTATGTFPSVRLVYDPKEPEKATLELLTKKDGLDDVTTGAVFEVSGTTIASAEPFSVYDLSGRCVARDVTAATMAPGLYIVNAGGHVAKIALGR